MVRRKPKDLNCSANTNEIQFDDRSFIDGVFNNEYMLVIGSAVILNRNKEEFADSKGDINQYIINEINKEQHKNWANFTEISRGTSISENNHIYELLSNYEFDLDDISEELTQLLRTKLFRTVLTTTIDSNVEALMHEIWGNELRIVNINDGGSMRSFQNALHKSWDKKHRQTYNQPTLIYVFGKVDETSNYRHNFVETDVDAIKYIEAWIKDVDTKDVIPFLKTKRILGLGCKFDDWYFRFFWYILTRSFSVSDRDGMKNTNGDIITNDNLATMFDPHNPSDQSLKTYLQQRGVCIHDDVDVWSFMKHIHHMLTSIEQDSPFRQLILDRRKEEGIFISYKSEDLLPASELFFQLSRKRDLNVWFDHVSLHGGDEYDDAIHKAIKKSKIFVPILSGNVSQDLKDKGEAIDTYYSKEWRWAKENEEIIVLPIAINGYDLRSEQNQIFEKIVGHKPSGIDLNDPLTKDNEYLLNENHGFTKFLESLYNKLGITE